MKYGIVKQKAQTFANERHKDVYICKAKRNNHYCIIFDTSQLTKNHDIIETVEPHYCESCKYAMYDSVPYGMGSCSYLSGCAKEDDMLEYQVEQSENGWCDLWQPCFVDDNLDDYINQTV